MAAAERAGARPQRIIFRPRRKPKTHMNIAAVTPAQMVHAVESWRSGALVSSVRGDSISPNLSGVGSSRRACHIRHLIRLWVCCEFQDISISKITRRAQGGSPYVHGAALRSPSKGPDSQPAVGFPFREPEKEEPDEARPLIRRIRTGKNLERQTLVKPHHKYSLP